MIGNNREELRGCQGRRRALSNEQSGSGLEKEKIGNPSVRVAITEN